MKQHIKTIGLLLVSLLALAACKVEYIPEGNKQQSEFKTLQDVKWTREAMYETVRGAESPGNLFLGDYQADLYNVVTASDNGTFGKFYDWDEQLMSSADEVAAYYGSYCALIKDANYFIMRAEEFLDNEELTKGLSDIEKGNVQTYIAEARTLRALAHYRLMTRFSKRYNEANDGGDLGIVMMKKYDPLFKDTPKTRSTQKEVYTWCLNELAEAAKKLPKKALYKDLRMGDIPCYLIKEYAYAVRARILLEMHRYKEAIEEVDKFIDTFPLSEHQTPENAEMPNDPKAFVNLWRYETSSEIMIKTYADKKVGRVGGILHGLRYIKEAQGPKTPDAEVALPVWLPTQYLLDLYEKPIDTKKNPSGKDWRYLTWFENGSDKPHNVDVVVNFARGATFVSKFRGNPEFDQNPEKHLYSYAHTTHLFDIAEAHLIKAEAQAWSGDVAGATATLENLRQHRGIGGLDLKATTQDQIKQAVMNERTREMIGMGTRMTDLKRWGEDLNREDKPAQDALVNSPGALHEKSIKLHKSHTDKMFIWEFPLQDRFANKDLVWNW